MRIPLASVDHMRTLQAKIIEEMGVQPQIDPAEEVRKRVTFLKEYLKATGTKGFVLGISGGLDSSLAGRLAQLAVEELQSEGVDAQFVAVRLPYGVQHDEDDAQAALDFIKASKEWTFDISAAVDGFEDEFEKTVGNGISDFHKGNTKARTRMIAQYALAGSTTTSSSARTTELSPSPGSSPSSATAGPTSCRCSV